MKELKDLHYFRKIRSQSFVKSWDGAVLQPPGQFELQPLLKCATSLFNINLQEGVVDDLDQCIFGDSSLSSPDHTPPASRSPSPLPPFPHSPPPPHPNASDSIETRQQGRSKKRSRQNRRAARQKKALAANPQVFNSYQPPPKSLEKYRDRYFSRSLKVGFDLSEESKVAPSGFVGGRRGFSAKESYSLSELKTNKGFTVFPWDGITPTPIADKTGRIFGLCAGQPGDPNDVGWQRDLRDAVRLLEEARGKLRLPEGSDDHRRGHFVAVPCGVSHGNGTKQPCNTFHSRANSEVLQGLNRSKPFRRMAGFGSAVFSAWFPATYAYYVDRLGALYAHDDQLKRNFSNSVFPSVTYNLGPSTVCRLHTDAANLPFGLCIITALGSYNPKTGGHIVLWDCGVIIEFPPGSSIAIPSAVVAHMNIPILEGETRYSVTQYAAGGLFRWVEHGFQTDSKYFARFSEEEKGVEMDREAERWDAGVDLFPNLSDINLVREQRGVEQLQ